MGEQYRPGDVVKGKILTATGEWVPVHSLYSLDPPGTAPVVRGPSWGKKVAMGFVWIVLAGWLCAGTAAGVVVYAIGVLVGGLPAGAELISSLAGIGLGVWWFSSWLAKQHLATMR